MLRDGELDALFTARGPSSFLRGEPHIKRLFPDIRATEMAYYKKTKLFPIMHLVGIRKSLVAQHPWLATSLYKAFLEAKALAMIDLLDVNALMVTLPWLSAETHATQAVMGKDFWRYGVDESRHEIEALCQYLHEQGLTDRRVVGRGIVRAGDHGHVEGVRRRARPTSCKPSRSDFDHTVRQFIGIGWRRRKVPAEQLAGTSTAFTSPIGERAGSCRGDDVLRELVELGLRDLA